jgi:rhodanese-related sulfurtransferase
VWLPANDFDAGLDLLVAEFWPGANRSEVPLVVYCYGPTCTRSRNCTTFAAARGFRRLYWFKDGPQGWLALGERLVDLR